MTNWFQVYHFFFPFLKKLCIHYKHIYMIQSANVWMALWNAHICLSSLFKLLDGKVLLPCYLQSAQIDKCNCVNELHATIYVYDYQNNKSSVKKWTMTSRRSAKCACECVWIGADSSIVIYLVKTWMVYGQWIAPTLLMLINIFSAMSMRLLSIDKTNGKRRRRRRRGLRSIHSTYCIEF